MAILLALPAAWALGCGSGRGSASPDTDAGAAIPSDVAAGCGRLCDRAVECFLDGDARSVCVDRCEAEVTPWGAPGTDALVRCARCLEDHGCEAIADGICDDACPREGLRPWPAGRDGGVAGDRCMVQWRQDGLRLDLTCERAAPTDSYDCSCAQDGVVGGSFRSVDLCSVDRTDQAHEAAEGCDWPLESPCSHAFTQIDSPEELGAPSTVWQVQCSPDPSSADVSYECTCLEDDTETGSFTDGTFCASQGSERLDAASDACGWDFGEAGCAPSWSVGGRTLSLRCGPPGPDTTSDRSGYTEVYVRCECVDDGTVVGDGAYTIAGTFCTTTLNVQSAVAERLCGWALP